MKKQQRLKRTLKDELLEEFKGADIVRPENFRSRLSFNFKQNSQRDKR